jgi:hypothetical protein
VARIDKSQSNLNHRAPLAADVSSSADYDKVLGVGINTSGQAVLKAASNSGFVGITIVDRTKRRAGQIIDILVRTWGRSSRLPAGVAGTKYYADGVTGALVAGTGARTDTPPGPLPGTRRSGSRSRQPQGWPVSWSAFGSELSGRLRTVQHSSTGRTTGCSGPRTIVMPGVHARACVDQEGHASGQVPAVAGLHTDRYRGWCATARNTEASTRPPTSSLRRWTGSTSTTSGASSSRRGDQAQNAERGSVMVDLPDVRGHQ